MTQPQTPDPKDETPSWELAELGDAQFPIGMPEDKATWDNERQRLMSQQLPLRKQSPLDHAFYVAGTVKESLTRLGKPLAALAVALPVLAAVIVVLTSGGDDATEADFLVDGQIPAVDTTPFAAPRETPVVGPPSAVLPQLLGFQVYRNSDFSWPVEGTILLASVDANKTLVLEPARPIELVRASARGTVSAAAGDSITINHEGTKQTQYSSLTEIRVSPGQRVERDQVIAYANGAGRGVLRFELRENGVAIDPLLYLPTTSADPTSSQAENVSCGDGGVVMDPASTVRLLLGTEGVKYLVESAAVVKVPGIPNLDVQLPGNQAITLRVPRAMSTSTQMYSLDLVLKGADGRYSASCPLALTTASSIPSRAPLPPGFVDPEIPPTPVPPTPEPSPTPVPVSPVPPPVRSAPDPIATPVKVSTPAKTPSPRPTSSPVSRPPAPIMSTPVTGAPPTRIATTPTPARR